MMRRSEQRQRKAQGEAPEYRVENTTVRRTTRTDHTIELRQKYVGNIQANPATYNRAFADVLRQMADAIADVRNAWVDPEIVVWTHAGGEITAEAILSPES